VSSAEAKVLLQAYRVGTEDENEPMFKAALNELAHDPELAAWFRAEQELEAVMMKKFSEVPVNTAMKEHILHALEAAVEAHSLRPQ